MDSGIYRPRSCMTLGRGCWSPTPLCIQCGQYWGHIRPSGNAYWWLMIGDSTGLLLLVCRQFQGGWTKTGSIYCITGRGFYTFIVENIFFFTPIKPIGIVGSNMGVTNNKGIVKEVASLLKSSKAFPHPDMVSPKEYWNPLVNHKNGLVNSKRCQENNWV